MQLFFKILRIFEDVFMGIAGLAALGLVCFDVVTRYLFPAYLQDWTGEVTVYLTAAAMLLGGGLLVQENRHIRADLITRSLSIPIQHALEIAATFVGLIFCLVVAWFGIEAVEFSRLLDVRSESSIQFPLWIFYLCLPTAFGLMAIRYMHKLYVVIAQFDPAMLDADNYEHPMED